MSGNGAMGRRMMLAGIGAALACRPVAAAPPGPCGCCLSGNAAAVTAAMGGVQETSGNRRLDTALGEVLAELAAILRVRPGFAYYADGGAPNAVALSQTRLAASSGTVLLGLGLLARVDSVAHGDLFVQAVCAHEFAHIRQYRTPYYERLDRPDTVRLVELHADFLAGYCLARQRRGLQAEALVSLGRAWEGLGDSDYTAPEHHGTAEERIAAMEQGFALGRKRVDIERATEAGARYLGA